jgi:hypothetical protein
VELEAQDGNGFEGQNVESQLSAGAYDHGEERQLSDLSAREIYAAMLQEYTKRDLTASSDALNAFNGILDSLESTTDCKFHFGIPTCIFNMGLTFCYRHESGQESRRPAFPSWSWTGRKGKVINLSMSAHLATTWISQQTWIVWFCRGEESGRVEPLSPWELDSTNRPSWNKKFNSNGESISERPFIANSDQVFPSASLSQPEVTYTNFTGSLLNKAKLLQFWTVSVNFRIARPTRRSPYDFEIYGRDGSVAGDISFYRNPPFRGQRSPEALQEFIMIAGLPDKWIRLVDEESPFRKKVWEGDNGHHLLLIEWHESRSGLKIAERLAAAHLNHSYIEKSFGPGPTWEEIILG